MWRAASFSSFAEFLHLHLDDLLNHKLLAYCWKVPCSKKSVFKLDTVWSEQMKLSFIASIIKRFLPTLNFSNIRQSSKVLTVVSQYVRHCGYESYRSLEKHHDRAMRKFRTGKSFFLKNSPQSFTQHNRNKPESSQHTRTFSERYIHTCSATLLAQCFHARSRLEPYEGPHS